MWPSGLAGIFIECGLVGCFCFEGLFSVLKIYILAEGHTMNKNGVYTCVCIFFPVLTCSAALLHF